MFIVYLPWGSGDRGAMTLCELHDIYQVVVFWLVEVPTCLALGKKLACLPPSSVPPPLSLSPDVLADKMEVNGQAARGVRWHHSQADSPV